MILDFNNVNYNSEYSFRSSWSKNTILPMLFLVSGLCIKYKKDIILNNVPKLRDVKIAINYLEELWIVFITNNNSLTISIKSKLNNTINYELYSEFRYSILTFGLLLPFFDEIKIPNKTWWCSIWDRKNNLHYDFFVKLWFDVHESDSWIYIKKKNNIPNKIVFNPDIASTSVTENIIIFLSLYIKKETDISISNFYWNRPDIYELLKLLKIFWIDFEFINKQLKKIKYNQTNLDSIIRYDILSDFDQALFYILLSIVIKSKVKYVNYFNSYSYKEINFLNKIFWKFINIKNNTIFINGHLVDKKNRDLIIIADEYPNIMSDSQPIMSIIWLFVKSLKITDKRFLNRYNYSEYYNLFNCNNKISWNSITIFWSKTKTSWKNINKNIELYSIRESWLLLILSIFFKAKININNTNIIDRWYENIYDNLILIWTNVTN